MRKRYFITEDFTKKKFSGQIVYETGRELVILDDSPADYYVAQFHSDEPQLDPDEVDTYHIPKSIVRTEAWQRIFICGDVYEVPLKDAIAYLEAVASNDHHGGFEPKYRILLNVVSMPASQEKCKELLENKERCGW